MKRVHDEKRDKYYQSYHEDIADMLDMGDRIYLAKRFWFYSTKEEPAPEDTITVPQKQKAYNRTVQSQFVAYQVASKPVFFAYSGNWAIKVSTTATRMGLSGRMKYREFNEIVYLNSNNLADFLFDERLVNRFLDKHKQKEYVVRLRQREAVQAQLDAEKEMEQQQTHKGSKWKMAP